MQDLVRIRSLLKIGRKADCGTYYIHTGDLNWWLFYNDQSLEMLHHLYLWEDQEHLLGWVLFSLHFHTFDVFVHPALRGSPQAGTMYLWAIQRLDEIISSRRGNAISTMWIDEHDDWLVGLLERQGFKRSPVSMQRLQRNLLEPLPEIRLPDGFHIRPVQSEAEAPQRAAASYAVFESDWEWKRYLRRYLNFMRSPVYMPELDLVVVAPDGQHAAFCICWPDAVNRVGLFEPVGTQPGFQRLGLGKAIVTQGLDTLRQQGMHNAQVCAESENQAALSLYESIGFQSRGRLCTYSRTVAA
jgi:ribosomal protein S18 acetylase RimI-like enzyme